MPFLGYHARRPPRVPGRTVSLTPPVASPLGRRSARNDARRGLDDDPPPVRPLARHRAARLGGRSRWRSSWGSWPCGPGRTPPPTTRPDRRPALAASGPRSSRRSRRPSRVARSTTCTPSCSSSRRSIFLLVEGLIVFAVIRYRRKPTDTELPPQIHGNNTLEIVWTVIPTAIVAAPLRPLVADPQRRRRDEGGVRRDPHPGRGHPLPVDLRVHLGRRQQDRALRRSTRPEMVVPAGRTVHLALRATDVIHAFYVPQFLFKRDVGPGQGERLRLQRRSARSRPAGRLPRPVRRAVRPPALGHAVHGQGPGPGGVRSPGCKEQIDAANAKPSPQPSGVPAGDGPRAGGQERRLRQEDPRGAGRQAVRHQVHQQRRRASPTTSPSRTPRGPRCSRARSSRVSTAGPMRSRPSALARTPSSAPSIRT